MRRKLLICAQQFTVKLCSFSSAGVYQKGGGGSHAASASMNTVEQVAPTRGPSSHRHYSVQRSSPQYDIFDDFGMGEQSRWAIYMYTLCGGYA